MKKLIKLTMLLPLAFVLSGCLDMLETISLHDGQAEISIRYTLQKTVLEMAASFSGEEPDYEGFSFIEDTYFSNYENMQTEIIPINNTYHLGAEIRIEGPVAQMLREAEIPYFIPRKQGDSYTILIPSLSEDNGEEVDMSAIAFLGGTTYTLLIDLSGDLADLQNARLKTIKGSGLPGGTPDIMVNIYNATMLVEIPMILLFSSPEDITLEIY